MGEEKKIARRSRAKKVKEIEHSVKLNYTDEDRIKVVRMLIDSVINYCLGHSDRSKGVIRYYTKIRSRQASICIKRVCDYVIRPELYKDFVELRSMSLMNMM